jgi:hypothetical protein
MQKRLLIPERIRQVPRQFSWVDQRLVRDRYIEHCDVQALALYLFLITVADAQGLSYYADGSICRLLSLDVEHLIHARQALIRAGMIAYETPLYQVLALGSCAAPEQPTPTSTIPVRASTKGLRSIREVLHQALEQTS